jgi:hypothetical protein
MKVGLKKFIKLCKSGLDRKVQVYFIKINSAAELKELIIFTDENGISFQSPIKEQIQEYKEIFTLFHGKPEDQYDLFLKNTLEVDEGVLGEFVFLNWGEKAIFNIVNHQMHYELITWRNKEKLTNQEQSIISEKKVAVIGSSVGSFATRVLSKSGFQYINVAEIKNMKPSNSTRMYQDSIRNYGQHKLIPLVQSIYEFNPFTQLKYFEEGLQKENINDVLFINDRPVDIIIDAADDGKTKVLIREFCKKYGIPLVYGFDEKGIVAIQRYDKPELNTFKEPNYSMAELDNEKLKAPNNYMMKVLDFIPGGGYEALGDRQKQTIEKMIDNTLGGFSQLAWEASLFASYITKASIDIVLGKNIAGYRHIDLDILISEEMTIIDYKDAG